MESDLAPSKGGGRLCGQAPYRSADNAVFLAFSSGSYATCGVFVCTIGESRCTGRRCWELFDASVSLDTDAGGVVVNKPPRIDLERPVMQADR